MLENAQGAERTCLQDGSRTATDTMTGLQYLTVIGLVAPVSVHSQQTRVCHLENAKNCVGQTNDATTLRTMAVQFVIFTLWTGATLVLHLESFLS